MGAGGLIEAGQVGVRDSDSSKGKEEKQTAP